MTTDTIAAQVWRIKNLSAFAKKSGIPYRTLCRIKLEPGHQIAPTTRLALEAAMRRIKPELKTEIMKTASDLISEMQIEADEHFMLLDSIALQKALKNEKRRALARKKAGKS